MYKYEKNSSSCDCQSEFEVASLLLLESSLVPVRVTIIGPNTECGVKHIVHALASPSTLQ